MKVNFMNLFTEPTLLIDLKVTFIRYKCIMNLNIVAINVFAQIT